MQRNVVKTLTSYRQRIQALNPAVNAFISVSPQPPAPSCSSERHPPLADIAVAVKDNISTSTLPTTCASKILRSYTAPYDATVVRLLQDNGADIIGKTNCDEFGMGSMNVYSAFGSVKNPLYPTTGEDGGEQRSAGGSSGGSAAAVAAGLCDAALGTDTGGSIRLPASYCGVVGFKPSYGLVSRWGVVSYADSLDCVGVLSKKVDVVERVFDILNQYDPRDPTSAPNDIRAKASSSSSSSSSSSPFSVLRNLRIGIPSEYFPSELSQTLHTSLSALLRKLKSHGAQITPVSLPHTKYALSAYYVLASAEASSNLARFDGVQYGSRAAPQAQDTGGTNDVASIYALTRSEGFGREVKKRIMLGTYALSADAFENYFLQAQKIRQMVRNDFNGVFKLPNFFSDYDGDQYRLAGSPTGKSGVDVLLHPSAIRTAPRLDKKANALDAYVQDVLTVPGSLGGLPAVSIPAGSTQLETTDPLGVGVGVSVVGQWGSDRLVLQVGNAIDHVIQGLD